MFDESLDATQTNWVVAVDWIRLISVIRPGLYKGQKDVACSKLHFILYYEYDD